MVTNDLLTTRDAVPWAKTVGLSIWLLLSVAMLFAGACTSVGCEQPGDIEEPSLETSEVQDAQRVDEGDPCHDGNVSARCSPEHSDVR